MAQSMKILNRPLCPRTVPLHDQSRFLLCSELQSVHIDCQAQSPRLGRYDLGQDKVDRSSGEAKN